MSCLVKKFAIANTSFFIHGRNKVLEEDPRFLMQSMRFDASFMGNIFRIEICILNDKMI